MSLNSSRPSRTRLFDAARGLRAALAILLSLGMLAVASACGMEVQTNQPYTPAEGVNFDVGNPSDPKTVVHVRNLLIISKAPGEGIVSASLVTAGRDQLTGITGVPIKVDGTDGAPFTATIPNTVSLANNLLVVLTDGPPITVKSADIEAGLSATLTLTFESAGEATVKVPIVDGNEPHYATISPAPTPST